MRHGLDLPLTNCRSCTPPFAGQHNIQQRIQYHKKVKDENAQLKEELSKLRVDLNIISVRYDRAKAELARFREAAGQVWGLGLVGERPLGWWAGVQAWGKVWDSQGVLQCPACSCHQRDLQS